MVMCIYLEHYCESIELIATEDVKVYEKMIDSYEERMAQMDKHGRWLSL